MFFKTLIFLCLLISDHTHWPDAYNSFFTLEATGYALLALLKGGHVKEAAAPFKWLNQQRRVGGGYGSTQVLDIINFCNYLGHSFAMTCSLTVMAYSGHCSFFFKKVFIKEVLCVLGWGGLIVIL